MIILHCLSLNNEVFDIFLSKKEAVKKQRELIKSQGFLPAYYHFPLEQSQYFKEEWRFLEKKTSYGITDTEACNENHRPHTH